jgi:pantothenate kinase type III
MARKKGSKAGVKPVRVKTDVSVPVRVSTHELFQASEELRTFAQAVRDKLDGTATEKANLGKFLATIDDIQGLIKEACEEIEGGNPMFHDFKIKVRI